ncbi:Uncharacterised protein [Rhodococcus gordoniae]|uniref:Uncharacterized protein n=1 Tax=Rhodococcus gordoniae TaxID=223392 RepID=A0A379M0U6_9NOCA|nr:DUF6480 family protein [Rhodococcus gordoniae]SUE15929.1 Uncharacterised protein [Rhodococcus gordoniae]
MTTSDPEHHGSQDPEPSRTPDLEPGGGVAPGSTPPDSGTTSGLSAPEPDTRKRFPISGWLTLLAVAVIVIIFVAAIFGILA